MKQIIERAMHGDADAFVQLMEINAQSMYKTARGFFRNSEQLKIPEIAGILGMNENTVKTRLKRGREEVKQLVS